MRCYLSQLSLMRKEKRGQRRRRASVASDKATSKGTAVFFPIDAPLDFATQPLRKRERANMLGSITYWHDEITKAPRFQTRVKERKRVQVANTICLLTSCLNKVEKK